MAPLVGCSSKTATIAFALFLQCLATTTAFQPSSRLLHLHSSRSVMLPTANRNIRKRAPKTVPKIKSSTSLSISIAAPVAIISSVAASLSSVVVLAAVVLIHEAGHYLAARSFGITVEEFSVGVGPKLVGFQSKANEFNLRAIPLGGYVRFPENYNTTLLRDQEIQANEERRAQKEIYMQANPDQTQNLTPAATVLNALTFGAIARNKDEQNKLRLQKIQEESEQNQSWWQKTFANERKGKSNNSQTSNQAQPEKKEPEIEYYDDPKLLQNRPWAERAVVLSGGIIFNFILAFACYFGEITIGSGLRQPVFEQGAIIQTVDQSGAGAAGLLKMGDIIVGINGSPMTGSIYPSAGAAQQSITDLVSAIRTTTNGDSVQLSILHPSSKSSPPRPDFVTVQPKRLLDGNGKMGPPSIGVMLSPNYVRTEVVRTSSAGEAAKLAGKAVGELTGQTAGSFKNLLASGSASQMSGPIGLINSGSNVVKTKDSGALVAFVAAISINLAVVNSLPLPALDGGQLVFVLAEAVTGKKVNQKFQESLTAATVFFLLLFSASTAFGDVYNIFLK